MLNGYTVVELAAGMAGVLPGKMAAEMGARVIRVEPAHGDPFSTIYPAYRSWNAAKEHVQWESTVMLHELLATADVCIVGGEDHPFVARPVDGVELAERHPNLIVVDIVGAPPGTRPLPAHDLLAQARSGLVWEISDQRPYALPVRLAAYGSVFQAMLLMVGALFRRETTGQGALVHASLLEGAIGWLAAEWISSEVSDKQIDGKLPKDTQLPMVECGDGVWIFYTHGPAGTSEVVERIVGLPPRGDRPAASKDDAFGDVEGVARQAKMWRAADLRDALVTAGVACDLIQPPGACWSDPQLEFNKTLVSYDGCRGVGVPFTWI